MTRKLSRSVVRRLISRASLGVKLAYDTRPKPKFKSKAGSLPGPLLDLSVLGLFVILGSAYIVWPS